MTPALHVIIGFLAVAGLLSTENEVRGSVTYRERMALPPGSELTVSLDRLGVVGPSRLSTLTMRLDDKQVPVKFSLPYVTSGSDVCRVFAEIRSGGKRLFHSVTPTTFEAGRPIHAELVLKQVVAEAQGLEDRDWDLVSLEGTAIGLEGEKPSLRLKSSDGTIQGHGGVNRFGGTYTWSDQLVQLDPGPMTLMAGPPERMEVESQFLRLLPLANKVAVSDEGLRLLRGDRELARFVARKPG